MEKGEFNHLTSIVTIFILKATMALYELDDVIMHELLLLVEYRILIGVFHLSKVKCGYMPSEFSLITNLLCYYFDGCRPKENATSYTFIIKSLNISPNPGSSDLRPRYFAVGANDSPEVVFLKFIFNKIYLADLCVCFWVMENVTVAELCLLLVLSLEFYEF